MGNYNSSSKNTITTKKANRNNALNSLIKLAIVPVAVAIVQEIPRIIEALKK